jgi:hypothetical protein
MRRGGEPAKLALRLDAYASDKRLSVVPDFFWTTTGRLWELPVRLQESFRGAALVVAKGDINYRRLTNDAIWPPGSSPDQPVAEFRAPMLMLRTLKSDTLIGVSAENLDQLNRTAPPDWRTSGAYAVAQTTD